MAQEVFRRVEKKFLLTTAQADALAARLSEQMLPDSYNRDGKAYTICNLYYDTIHSSLIRESLRKPVYKEKLRLRGYGTPSPDDLVFLEMKKKYDGVVSKRRTQLPLAAAYEFLQSGVPPADPGNANLQVLSELSYLLGRLPLVPRVYLAYDRYAWFAREDSGLRLTFDYRIRTRWDDLRLESGDRGALLLRDDLVLMELKAEGSVPVWMAHLLSGVQAHHTSFSKYGAAYLQRLSQSESEGAYVKCLSPSLQNCFAAPGTPAYR